MTNIQEHSFDRQDTKIIEDQYEEALSTIRQVILSGGIFWSMVLFMPPSVWNFFIADSDDPVLYPFFQSPVMLTITTVFIIGGLSMHYFIVHSFKKDLKDKIKLEGIVEVSKVSTLSDKVAKKLDGKNTILHFSENNLQAQLLFNKRLEPDLLQAKRIQLTIAKHSKLALKKIVIN